MPQCLRLKMAKENKQTQLELGAPIMTREHYILVGSLSFMSFFAGAGALGMALAFELVRVAGV